MLLRGFKSWKILYPMLLIGLVTSYGLHGYDILDNPAKLFVQFN